MSKATQAYGEKVRAHLEESFPDAPPPLINLVDADWRTAVKAKCPPPSTMKEVDVDTTISDTIYAWLADLRYEGVGTIMVNAERHAAEAEAKQHAELQKRQAELEPLANLVRSIVSQCLIDAGLAQPAGIAPKVLQHPTKRGPGRGRK